MLAEPTTYEELQAHYAAVRQRMGMGPARNFVPIERVTPPPPVVVAPKPEPRPRPVPLTNEEREARKRAVRRLANEAVVMGPPDGQYLFRSTILDIVAEIAGISATEIMSRRRDYQAVPARQVACWLMRRYSSDPLLCNIGKSVGGRDHTSVGHAIGRVEQVIRLIGPSPENTMRGWASHLLAHRWPHANRGDA